MTFEERFPNNVPTITLQTISGLIIKHLTEWSPSEFLSLSFTRRLQVLKASSLHKGTCAYRCLESLKPWNKDLGARSCWIACLTQEIAIPWSGQCAVTMELFVKFVSFVLFLIYWMIHSTPWRALVWESRITVVKSYVIMSQTCSELNYSYHLDEPPNRSQKGTVKLRSIGRTSLGQRERWRWSTLTSQVNPASSRGQGDQPEEAAFLRQGSSKRRWGTTNS